MLPFICNVLFKNIKKLSLAGNTCVDPPDCAVNVLSNPSNVTSATPIWKNGCVDEVLVIPVKFPVFVPTFNVIDVFATTESILIAVS